MEATKRSPTSLQLQQLFGREMQSATPSSFSSSTQPVSDEIVREDVDKSRKISVSAGDGWPSYESKSRAAREKESQSQN